MFKALVILCILLGYAYDFATAWLDDRWEKKHALPESVRDIYDEKEYQRWKQYSAEKKKLRLVSGLINLAALLGMFLLSERLSGVQTVGMTLAFACIVLSNWDAVRKVAQSAISDEQV